MGHPPFSETLPGDSWERAADVAKNMHASINSVSTGVLDYTGVSGYDPNVVLLTPHAQQRAQGRVNVSHNFNRNLLCTEAVVTDFPSEAINISNGYSHFPVMLFNTIRTIYV